MERIVDIRPEKNKRRADIKRFRQMMPSEQKNALDRKIQNRLMNLWVFRETRTILSYVSTPSEMDTVYLIETALKSGKTVAVPRCEDQAGKMSFYVIRSLSELSPGYFGVLEPKTHCMPYDFGTEKTLCIVPALTFDREGYRLGYGKGYYDRFLNSFSGTTVGMCYACCLSEALPHGKYDKAVDMLITEKEILNGLNKEASTNGQKK